MGIQLCHTSYRKQAVLFKSRPVLIDEIIQWGKEMISNVPWDLVGQEAGPLEVEVSKAIGNMAKNVRDFIERAGRFVLN